jgi:hypothetical protein
VYQPILKLEETNAACRIQLTKTLSTIHKVRVVAGKGEVTEDGCRGFAFFLAFEPWETCLKHPPGSARFFDAAEKTGLLLPQEAEQLSKTLIRHGAEMARVYSGVFSPFFSDPRVRTILTSVDDLNHLSESGLAIGGSWADRLHETCPFPLYPNNHLGVKSFRRITMEGELEFYAQSPWLAWVEALDLICGGPWAGFRPDSIMKMVTALEQRVVRHKSAPVEIADEILGHKVVLPMFSRGLQGVVFGIFTDVPKAELEPILTLLLQFGETVSDAYADFRWHSFLSAMKGDLDEETLAREVINVVSPIARIIVSRGDRQAGFKIGSESNYWAGYQPLSKKELLSVDYQNGFTIVGPDQAEIYIEPITNIPNLNPEFTRVRLENHLNQALASILAPPDGLALAFADVRELREDFEAYTKEDNASLAKLRQFYVVQKIEKYWHRSIVRVTNSELKGFLEEQLGREVKNGYQVTSFAGDFEKIFSGKITATKTRSALSLSWNKGS